MSGLDEQNIFSCPACENEGRKEIKYWSFTKNTNPYSVEADVAYIDRNPIESVCVIDKIPKKTNFIWQYRISTGKEKEKYNAKLEKEDKLVIKCNGGHILENNILRDNIFRFAKRAIESKEVAWE
jgi:hypothetical protein